jgi:hypothetical protein
MKQDFTKLLKEFTRERETLDVKYICSLQDEDLPDVFFRKIAIDPVTYPRMAKGILMVTSVEYKLLTQYKQEFIAWLNLQQ